MGENWMVTKLGKKKGEGTCSEITSVNLHINIRMGENVILVILTIAGLLVPDRLV